MTPRVPLRFQATARDGGRVLHGRECVAEIKRLALIHFIPLGLNASDWNRGRERQRVESRLAGARRYEADSLVGAEVGMPFYWRQYGNHQDPERRMEFRRRLTLVEQTATMIRLRASGTTRSGSARSDYEITFRIDARGRLRCEVEAVLTVA